MKHRVPYAANAISLVVTLLLLTGCRGDWGTASGTVTLDGQRMNKGVVTFHPATSGAAGYANINSDGTFSVMTGAETGLKTGDYVVTVTDHNIPDSTKSETAKLLTPEKYASPATSDFKVTVKPGGNRFDFALKK